MRGTSRSVPVEGGKTIRVAIADDHFVVRAGLRQILGQDPEIEVVGEAADSREALDLGMRGRAEVLVLDLDMPGRGGLDALRQLHRSRPELAILVLSFYPEEEFALLALREGASGYLSKTRTPEELVDAVHRVASGGRFVSAKTAELLAERIGGEEAARPHERLSALEVRILGLLGEGRTPNEIGQELLLSPKTVSSHRTHILRTMEMSSHAEIIQYAIECGMVAAAAAEKGHATAVA